jgi:two-component system NtrC family response regulator
MKLKVLVVDDDEAIRTQLKYALRDDFAVVFAEDRNEAIDVLRREHPELVTLDLGLPPHADGAEEGLKALGEIIQAAPATKVIVLTGNSDRKNAIRAIQLGAFDYHAKPIEVPALKVVLQRAAYLQTLEAESELHERAEESATRFQDIVGNTPAMRELFGLVTRVARTDATVLIQGESGTGKELLARAIHDRSNRRGRPFVAINCGAIPETLLESELFGHEKGAFTGAHIQRKGKLEVADRGSLFLDEIGEMNLTLQVKLLRFLQERQIERVGGREVLQVDARIISATNKDLKVELQAGRFREDLYYRLAVVNLKLPPLRERGEDIVLIANAVLRRHCEQQHRKSLRFSTAALEALSQYYWPGNIRELENAIERAVIMAKGKQVEAAELGIEVVSDSPALASLRESRDRAEREALVDALVKTRGNISRAAKLLGVSRPTFHGRLNRHEINAMDFR